jgi:RNA polymerase sigma factor (sigma-70 family)
MSPNAEKCIADLVDDLERQGGLDAQDLDRAIDRHKLTAPELTWVYSRLAELNIPIDARAPERFRAIASKVGDEMNRILSSAGRARLLTPEDEVDLGRRIQVGQLAALSGENVTGPERAAAIRDGRTAHELMVMSNLRLVVSIARRYGGHGLEPADLVQEGTIGLMRAADKFDHSLGFKFSTYATWWIRQSISRALADKARLIRLPVHIEEDLAKIAACRSTFEKEHQRTPSVDEIGATLDMPAEKVRLVLDSSRPLVSLDLRLPDSDTDLGEVLNLYSESVEDTVIGLLHTQDVKHALGSLERTYLPNAGGATVHAIEMLRLRFGLVDDEEWTLDQIGNKFGVTRERVRQILVKVLKSSELRRAFAGFEHSEGI